MLKLEPVALTDVGRKRSNNQDHLGDLIFRSGRSFGDEKLKERGYLFAVADGMGGYAGGEIASELAINTLFERFYDSPTSGDIATDLTEAIRQANSQVHNEAQANSNRSQMGTTLTLVLVKGNKAIFGNVGDSRTYLVRQGIPERVTHDHSLVQEQIDAGLLTPEQAERSGHKNFITRAIGHRDLVEPDLFEREIQPDDILLLCSDGLHGLVKEIEIGTIVATAPSLKEGVHQLVSLANERGGPDNISVLAVRIEQVGEPLPSILNGREAVYNVVNASIYNQATEPVSLNIGPTTVEESNKSTIRMTVPDPQAPAVQVTAPMTVASTRSRPGGRGLWLGLLLLLLVIGGAVAFVTLSGSPVASPATATPVTPTAPVSRAASTPSNTVADPTPVSPLPTATLKAGTNPTPVAVAAIQPIVPRTSPANTSAALVNGAEGAINNAAASVKPSALASADAIRCRIDQPNLLQQVQIQLVNLDKASSYEIKMTSNGRNVTSIFTDLGAGIYLSQVSSPLTSGEYELTVIKSEAGSLLSPTVYKIQLGAALVSTANCSTINIENKMVIQI